MEKDSETVITFAIDGPVIMKMCDDVPTLQRLCLSNYKNWQDAIERLKKARKQKNEWKQRTVDLEERLKEIHKWILAMEKSMAVLEKP
jgi:hypothetical protein